jgi:hypothetical protein
METIGTKVLFGPNPQEFDQFIERHISLMNQDFMKQNGNFHGNFITFQGTKEANPNTKLLKPK